MKQTLLTFLILLSLSVTAQTNPSAFDLSSGSYTFTSWANTSTAGTYPSNMAFHFTNDPTGGVAYNPLAPGNSDFNCAYNISSRNRFLGQGTNGFSFIATGTAQFNDCSSGTASSTRFAGAAVLAVNTTNRVNIKVEWTGGTIAVGDGNGTPANARIFSLQLQYRIGTSGDFTNASSSYVSSSAGNSAALSSTLPVAAQNQPVVQLRWVYYQTTSGNGTRPELRLDDITVSSEASTPVTYYSFKATLNEQKKAVLSWTTASEVNNAEFQIQRSANAESFEIIGRIAGKGTTQEKTDYTFIDDSPFAGTTYYRLKQIDLDGTSSLSRIVSVITTEPDFKAELTIFPNPAEREVEVRSKENTGIESITFFDIKGKRLSTTLGAKASVDQLPIGIYLLQVKTTDGLTLQKRFVKE